MNRPTTLALVFYLGFGTYAACAQGGGYVTQDDATTLWTNQAITDTSVVTSTAYSVRYMDGVAVFLNVWGQANDDVILDPLWTVDVDGNPVGYSASLLGRTDTVTVQTDNDSVFILPLDVPDGAEDFQLRIRNLSGGTINVTGSFRGRAVR